MWPIRRGNGYIFIIYYRTINQKDKLLLFIVFLCSQAEFIFFNADLDGENSSLHFNCPASVWFHISILLKVISCGIGTLITTSRSYMKVSNWFSPIAFKSSITVSTDSGTAIFLLLSFVRWSCVNGFTVIHLTSRLASEENLSWKGWLLSLRLVLDSARISFQSRQSSNSSIIRAISGLQVSQQKKAESSTLLSKSLVPPHPLISLLFCSWIWSRPTLENSRWDFWNEKFPFERKLQTLRSFISLV